AGERAKEARNELRALPGGLSAGLGGRFAGVGKLYLALEQGLDLVLDPVLLVALRLLLGCLGRRELGGAPGFLRCLVHCPLLGLAPGFIGGFALGSFLGFARRLFPGLDL